MKKEIATRFSVSLPPTLLEQLDEMTHEKSYDNRSLAIADMIRAQRQHAAIGKQKTSLHD